MASQHLKLKVMRPRIPNTIRPPAPPRLQIPQLQSPKRSTAHLTIRHRSVNLCKMNRPESLSPKQFNPQKSHNQHQIQLSTIKPRKRRLQGILLEPRHVAVLCLCEYLLDMPKRMLLTMMPQNRYNGSPRCRHWDRVVAGGRPLGEVTF